MDVNLPPPCPRPTITPEYQEGYAAYPSGVNPYKQSINTLSTSRYLWFFGHFCHGADIAIAKWESRHAQSDL